MLARLMAETKEPDLQRKIPPLFESNTKGKVWLKLLKAVERYDRQHRLIEELRQKPTSQSLQEGLAKENKKINAYKDLSPENVAAIRALKETDPDFFERVWVLAKNVFNHKEYTTLEDELWKDCDFTNDAVVSSDGEGEGTSHRGTGGGVAAPSADELLRPFDNAGRQQGHANPLTAPFAREGR